MSGEEMMRCPYNSAHVVMKSRMPSHLQKCRIQFPLENYSTCPFNATHDVPTPELKYHTDTCPDRKNMEKYLYVMDVEKEETPPNPDPVQLNIPGFEENWDEDRVSGSYLETKNKLQEQQKIFKPPIGRSKSIKKAFCQDQVRRFLREDEKQVGPSQH